MKPTEAVRNWAGGFDLRTERDSGNTVLILTGKKERSLEFWKGLQRLANDVVELLEHETKENELG